MIWSKPLPNGSTVCVEAALLPFKGYREGREYMVITRGPGQESKGVCKVDARGEPIKWYDHPAMTQTDWLEFLKELPSALAIEQVMET